MGKDRREEAKVLARSVIDDLLSHAAFAHEDSDSEGSSVHSGSPTSPRSIQGRKRAVSFSAKITSKDYKPGEIPAHLTTKTRESFKSNEEADAPRHKASLKNQFGVRKNSRKKS